jgi:predicted adenylyl cyclase CyaB
MKDIEIEIQVRIEDSSKLEAFLKKEAELTGDNYQKDEYFTPAHRDFAEVRPIKEWLRIRTSGQNSITYKNWHYDKEGRGDYCDEYETVVEDPDQLRKIFAALDMMPLITVEKKRQTWRYKDYEIALDHVTDLGDFVEIEHKAHEKSVDPKVVAGEMIAFLKEVGCGKIERDYRGYPFMLLYPNEVIFEEV